MKKEILTKVYDMIVGGRRLYAIRDYLKETVGDGGEVYITEAKRLIKENREMFEDEDLAVQLERLQYVYDLAEKAENVKIMFQVQTEMDKIKGLQKQDIKADVNTDFTVNFG